MINERDYVEVGIDCANVCTAISRGMNGTRLDEHNQSLCDAIGQLTT